MNNINSELNSKLKNVGISIFSKMTKMAVEYNALNLSQGFPDFNPPDELIKISFVLSEQGLQSICSNAWSKIIKRKYL